MSTFTPTPEQDEAIGRFLSGSDLVVRAGAGTGKTSTLTLMAEADPQRRGQYVAFNRSIVEEAGRKMPRNVNARTAHSLAFSAVGKPLAHKLQSKRMPSAKVAAMLGITDPVKIQIGQAAKWLAPGWLAGHVMRAMAIFCNSDDPTPTRRHVPYVEGLDLPDAAGRRTYQNNDLIAAAIAPTLEKAWADLISPAGQLRYTHDCQPPGTLVRRVTCGMPTAWEDVPIEDIREGDMVMSFTMGQRRGFVRRQGRRVTAVGERPFDGHLIRIRTERGRTSAVTPTHWCVARFDADLTGGNEVVYLSRRGDQFRVGRTTWRTPTQSNTLGIVRRTESQNADAVWVLSVHQTPEDAALAEAIVSHDFGIPSWTWKGPRTVMPRDLFWQHVGTNIAAATRCLTAHGRDVNYPLWTPSDGVRGNFKRPVKVRACNLLDGMLMCEPDELRPAAKGEMHAHDGSKAWSAVTLGYERYRGPVHNLDVDTDHTYVADGIVTGNCYLKLWELSGPTISADFILFDEAQDASPVMASIVAQQAGRAQRIYVGDSEQAIYAWRGAVDALNQLEAQDGVERTFLTQSFRFGPAIADMANACLALIPSAELRIVGFDQIPSRVTEVDDPAAFLCRTNARAMRAFLDTLDAGRRPHLIGGGKELASFARAWIQLRDEGWTPHPELSCFDSPAQVEDYVDADPQGSELALLVQLITEHTPEVLLEALDNQATEHTADQVISTAHRAKGREWSTVGLADDFPDPDERDISDEEMRLLYVAVTRAQEALDVSAVPLLRKLPAGQETAV